MKYVDADKLIDMIEMLNSLVSYESGDRHDDGLHDAYKAVKNIITSLQQEQQPVILDKSIELGLDRALYIVKDAKGNLPDYQTNDGIYECDSAIRTLENLLKNGIEQEQPEMDLDEEIYDYMKNHHLQMLDGGRIVFKNGDTPNFMCDFRDFARHFHELGKNARKSIWHNVAEGAPTENGLEVIVACRNKNKEDGIWLYDLIQCWEGKWEPRVNWETPVKWAYVRDLDNTRKEK